jgi:hypothetical protein
MGIPFGAIGFCLTVSKRPQNTSMIVAKTEVLTIKTKGTIIMNDPGVVGIGCFAKPEILSRVLRKMVEGYILGNLEGHTEKTKKITTNLGTLTQIRKRRLH